ncbi:Uncharacterised protein [Anaerobiospirillum thomasii]|uniref:Phage protein n=1 Tax=Anaerobiospirillum thomasii TaxID=179995 RepID=A0A2X0VDD9_9GAMM|nr:DUF6148 family protein [Anaerobiospirillum thomasii]SPT67637.1 Uncharacterised protein [Anaerobiospirillum thomasii]SPT70097.1 Uncharacterised protein [Anaerobiospirillum thomasii]SPT72429.1 Uncharacterised protein [Anaerobiospirillum thomasii]
MTEFNGITIEFAKERIKMWLDAEAAIATGQSYKIGSRTLTRANLKEVREQLDYWQGKLNSLENGGKGRRIIRAICEDR